jgi:plastocyanin
MGASVALAAALPPGAPARQPRPQAQELSISADNLAFSTSTLTATESASVMVHFTNNEASVPHSFAVYPVSSSSSPLAPGSAGSPCTGPCSYDVSFTAPAAGTYFFRCDVHPTQMTGQFVVEAAAQQPAATATQAGAPEPTDAAPTLASGATQAATVVSGVPAAGSGPPDGGDLDWWPVFLALPAAALLGSGWLLRLRRRG